MKKLTNKKGFTLMEMIIVVAIIAILAVVTIPTLTANTDKAAKAADAANLRSAKAAYQVLVMEDKKPVTNAVFDVAAGTFKTGENATTATAADACGQCGTHEGAHILFDGTNVVWSKGGATCN